MELWNFHRYQWPFLKVDEICRIKDTVELKRGDKIISITCARGPDLVDTFRFLASLRESDSLSWGILRQGQAADNVIDLVKLLDDERLLAEDVRRTRQAADEKLRKVSQAVIEVSSGMLSRARERVHETRVLADKFLSLINSLGTPGYCNIYSLPVSDENFYFSLLKCQIIYYSSSSPCTVVALKEICNAISSMEHYASSYNIANKLACLDLYSLDDILYHIGSFAEIFEEAMGLGCVRLINPPISESIFCSGAEFAVSLEQYIDECLIRHGMSDFERNARKSDSMHDPIVRGTYIEQYHITCRFVELITPLLSKRLHPNIRTLAFKYFFEEFGHERFELETCRELGVPDEYLLTTNPLPMTSAYIDVLTILSQVDPLSFIAAISCTEGLHAKNFKISELFPNNKAATGARTKLSDHDDLNVELNHASIPRQVFAEVISVDAGEQQRVLQNVSFVLELNLRCLDSIAAHYMDYSIEINS
jgi:hypothetical protein